MIQDSHQPSPVHSRSHRSSQALTKRRRLWTKRGLRWQPPWCCSGEGHRRAERSCSRKPGNAPREISRYTTTVWRCCFEVLVQYCNIPRRERWRPISRSHDGIEIAVRFVSFFTAMTSPRSQTEVFTRGADAICAQQLLQEVCPVSRHLRRRFDSCPKT